MNILQSPVAIAARLEVILYWNCSSFGKNVAKATTAPVSTVKATAIKLHVGLRKRAQTAEKKCVGRFFPLWHRSLGRRIPPRNENREVDVVWRY